MTPATKTDALVEAVSHLLEADRLVDDIVEVMLTANQRQPIDFAGYPPESITATSGGVSPSTRAYAVATNARRQARARAETALKSMTEQKTK